MPGPGFAAWDRAELRAMTREVGRRSRASHPEVSSLGGRAAHARGRAHRLTAEERARGIAAAHAALRARRERREQGLWMILA